MLKGRESVQPRKQNYAGADGEGVRGWGGGEKGYGEGEGRERSDGPRGWEEWDTTKEGKGKTGGMRK